MAERAGRFGLNTPDQRRHAELVRISNEMRGRQLTADEANFIVNLITNKEFPTQLAQLSAEDKGLIINILKTKILPAGVLAFGSNTGKYEMMLAAARKAFPGEFDETGSAAPAPPEALEQGSAAEPQPPSAVPQPQPAAPQPQSQPPSAVPQPQPAAPQPAAAAMDTTAARDTIVNAVRRITEIAQKVGITPPTSNSQVVFVAAPDKTTPIVYPPNFLPFKDSKLPAAVAMYYDVYTALTKAGGKFATVVNEQLDKATAADKELAKLSAQRNFAEYDAFMNALIDTLKVMRGLSAPPSDLAARFNPVVSAALAVDTKILLETCGSKAGMLESSKLKKNIETRDMTIESLKSQIEGLNVSSSGDVARLTKNLATRNTRIAELESARGEQERLAGQVQGLTRNVAARNARIGELQASVEQLTQQAADRLSSVQAQGRNSDTLRRERNSLTAEKRQLTEALKAARAQAMLNAQQKGRMGELQRQVEQLLPIQAAKQAANRELAQLRSVGAGMGEIQRQLTAKNEEVASLQAQLRGITAERDQRQSNLARAQGNLVGLRAERQSQGKSLTTLQREQAEYERRLSDLRAQIAGKNAEIASIKAQQPSARVAQLQRAVIPEVAEAPAAAAGAVFGRGAQLGEERVAPKPVTADQRARYTAAEQRKRAARAAIMGQGGGTRRNRRVQRQTRRR
jgi:hypothetical protein